MHKYRPRLHVIRTSEPSQIPWSPSQVFFFPDTDFVAVTAYQVSTGFSCHLTHPSIHWQLPIPNSHPSINWSAASNRVPLAIKCASQPWTLTVHFVLHIPERGISRSGECCADDGDDLVCLAGSLSVSCGETLSPINFRFFMGRLLLYPIPSAIIIFSDDRPVAAIPFSFACNGLAHPLRWKGPSVSASFHGLIIKQGLRGVSVGCHAKTIYIIKKQLG